MHEKSLSSTNFCALPFDHVIIRTNGAFDICCNHLTPQYSLVNINQADHRSWLESDYVQNVRSSFNQNQKHDGCRLCWQREDLGFDSMRTRTSKEYRLYPRNSDRAVKNIELQLGNLCNLQCLMCNETNSSAILAENMRLGINQIHQTDVTWNDLGYENLTKLLDERPYVLNIRGGEPLYNKNLLKLVNKIPDAQARDMVLQISTNATQWDDKWQKALSRFRLIRFVFSLDATGGLYEYLRYPASWTDVTKNIKSIISLDNAKCMVHCVGQNLNVSYLEPLIDWCEERALYLQIDYLENPFYLQIQNLPSTQKKIALTSLDKLLTRSLPSHLAKFLRSAKDRLITKDSDPLTWAEFVKQVQMRDNLRGNSYKPWIKEE